MNENTKGWEDLDLNIVEFTLPKIKILRNNTRSYPEKLNNIQEWKKILDSIIEELELYKNYRNSNLTVFFTWFTHLWS